MTRADHVAARIVHRRQGAPAHAFRYRADYVLYDPRAAAGAGVMALVRSRSDRVRHDWICGALAESGRAAALAGPTLLLTQPRRLGHRFTPAAFWFCHDAEGGLRAVVADVTNTYGDRHAYLCCHGDLRAIDRADRLVARKLLHVSPFQPPGGRYAFRFALRPDWVAVEIDYRHDRGGLRATLAGPRRPATPGGLVAGWLRRPFGSARTLGLIHWQALRLWRKGAPFRRRPAPPATPLSAGIGPEAESGHGALGAARRRGLS